MLLSAPCQTMHTYIDESFNIYDNHELKIISTAMQTTHGKPIYTFCFICCFFLCFGFLCLSFHLMHFRKLERASKTRRSNLVPLKWYQILWLCSIVGISCFIYFIIIIWIYFPHRIFNKLFSSFKFRLVESFWFHLSCCALSNYGYALCFEWWWYSWISCIWIIIFTPSMHYTISCIALYRNDSFFDLNRYCIKGNTANRDHFLMK